MNEENFNGENPDKMEGQNEVFDETPDNKELEVSLEVQLENELNHLELLNSLVTEIESHPVEEEIITKGN